MSKILCTRLVLEIKKIMQCAHAPWASHTYLNLTHSIWPRIGTKAYWKPMDARKFVYDAAAYARTTVRTPTTCKPMSNITLTAVKIRDPLTIIA